MKEIDIYIDGASKGNPGPGGIGVVIYSAGENIKNISSYIGNVTNNVAEYTALIYALQEAIMLKAEVLTINTDSQLLYRQIKKVYRVKSPNIIELYNRAIELMAAFKKVSMRNIRREENCDADKLASRAALTVKKVF